MIKNKGGAGMDGTDLVFLNGKVLTMDDDPSSARAVVVSNGKILYVGDEEKALTWEREETEVIDLQQKTLMPSFIESHIHPTMFAQSLLEVDCKPDTAPSIKTCWKR